MKKKATGKSPHWIYASVLVWEMSLLDISMSRKPRKVFCFSKSCPGSISSLNSLTLDLLKNNYDPETTSFI